MTTPAQTTTSVHCAHRRRPAPRYAWRTRVTGLAILLCMLVSLTVPAARAETAEPVEADVAVAWFELVLDLVRETPGFTPPVASRALGYLGVALYETVRPVDPTVRSLVGQLNGLTVLPHLREGVTIHGPIAANAALAHLARELFPTATPANQAAIDTLEQSIGARYHSAVDGPTYRRSVTWGRQVAHAVFAWSRYDGGHEGYASNFAGHYTGTDAPGHWQPTPPGFATGLQPTWGENRPFVLVHGGKCPALPPPVYSEHPQSAFYAEAYEVYVVVQNLTPDQFDIALFWADDPGRTATPPGHWIAILNQVVQAEQPALIVAGQAYARLGIALADAFITCWHTKYRYDLLRPISYIQAVIDPTWNTPALTDPVTTPPFPEYTSGHSVQSGAAATVLAALFGEAYAFVDHTHDRLGMQPRPFTSFMQAAEEAAISRLYGGIHFRAAIEQGLVQGQCIGGHVMALQFSR